MVLVDLRNESAWYAETMVNVECRIALHDDSSNLRGEIGVADSNANTWLRYMV